MSQTEHTTAAVVGGGPAGMMLGLLLAKAGVDVTVFEKHRDFLRDFRGDTVHPSTMELIDELGLWEQFQKIPQGKIQKVGLEDLQIGSLAELKLRHPYIAMAPQWDFLNMLVEEARHYPQFHLLMESEVVDALRQDGRVTGVRYRDGNGAEHEMSATLTVAADGRHSTVRAAAGLPTREFGAPFDVLWFRLPKSGDESQELYFRVAPYRWIVGFDRRTYVQIAYIIRKGTRDQLRAAGIEKFRRDLVETMPEFGGRVNELKSFDDIKFLEVRVNRAPRWHVPGLLLIGDAAHAMSPMGGVGINYAIQDAVAAANILCPGLLRAQRDGTPISDDVLHAVQRRRIFPTAFIQALQRIAQARFIDPALHGEVSAFPKFIKTLQRIGPLRRLFLRVLSVGVRPEHIHLPSQV